MNINYDALTNSVEETTPSKEEVAEHKLIAAQEQAAKEQVEADQALKLAAKLSAVQKLSALGLTEDEVTALLG
jgi:hypothetical protein